MRNLTLATVFGLAVFACGGRIDDDHGYSDASNVGGSTTASTADPYGVTATGVPTDEPIQGIGGSPSDVVTTTIAGGPNTQPSMGGSSSTAITSGSSIVTARRAIGEPCRVRTQSVEESGAFNHGLEASPQGFMVLRNVDGESRAQFWKADTLEMTETLIANNNDVLGVNLLSGTKDGFIFTTSAFTSVAGDLPQLMRYDANGVFAKKLPLWSNMDAYYGRVTAVGTTYDDYLVYMEKDYEVRDSKTVQRTTYSYMDIAKDGTFGKHGIMTSETGPDALYISDPTVINNTIGFLKVRSWGDATTDGIPSVTEMGIYDTIYGIYMNVAIQSLLSAPVNDTWKTVSVHSLLAQGDSFVVWWTDLSPEKPMDYLTRISVKGELGETNPLPSTGRIISLRASENGFWMARQEGAKEEILKLIELSTKAEVLSETIVDDAFSFYYVNELGFAETGSQFAFGWSQFVEDGPTFMKLRIKFVDCR